MVDYTINILGISLFSSVQAKQWNLEKTWSPVAGKGRPSWLFATTISLLPGKGQHRVDGCVLSFEKEGSRTVFENCPANWQGFACFVIPSGFLPSFVLYLSLRSLEGLIRRGRFVENVRISNFVEGKIERRAFKEEDEERRKGREVSTTLDWHLPTCSK